MSALDKGQVAAQKVMAFLATAHSQLSGETEEQKKVLKKELSKSEECLSSEEITDFLAFIYTQTENVEQLQKSTQYIPIFVQHEQEKLKKIPVEGLALFAHNLSFLHQVLNKELFSSDEDKSNDPDILAHKEALKIFQQYRIIFGHIMSYLSYVKVTGSESEYQIAVLALNPVVKQLLETDLMWLVSRLNKSANVKMDNRQKIIEHQRSTPIREAIKEITNFYGSSDLSVKLPKDIDNIYEVLTDSKKTIETKLKLIEKEKATLDGVRVENEKVQNIERENTITQILIETEEYIEKKKSHKKLEGKNGGDKKESLEIPNSSKTRKKLEFTANLKDILEEEHMSPKEKVLHVKVHLVTSDASSFIKHRNAVKRNTENFLERIANLLDNLAQRLSGKGRVKSKEEESHSNLQSPPSRFFAPPRSAKLMADWCNKVNVLQRRLTV